MADLETMVSARPQSSLGHPLVDLQRGGLRPGHGHGAPHGGAHARAGARARPVAARDRGDQRRDVRRAGRGPGPGRHRRQLLAGDLRRGARALPPHPPRERRRTPAPCHARRRDDRRARHALGQLRRASTRTSATRHDGAGSSSPSAPSWRGASCGRASTTAASRRRTCGPARAPTSAVIDTCGFAKDGFHLYRAMWTEGPVVHILPHWSWAGHGGGGRSGSCASPTATRWSCS